MTEAGFWSILASLPSLLESSVDEREAQLRQALKRLPDEDIAAFDRFFENSISAFYRPDTLEAAAKLRGSPHDQESFFTLACGVISLGRGRYHRILSCPSELSGLTPEELGSMADVWKLYYVASDHLAEVADVFEDEEVPADMPPRIQRPKLEGLVTGHPARPRDFPVGSPSDWL